MSKPFSLSPRDYAIIRKVWTLNECEKAFLRKYLLCTATSEEISNYLEWDEDIAKPYLERHGVVFDLEYYGSLSETWFTKARGQTYILSLRIRSQDRGIALVKLSEERDARTSEDRGIPSITDVVWSV